MSSKYKSGTSGLGSSSYSTGRPPYGSSSYTSPRATDLGSTRSYGSSSTASTGSYGGRDYGSSSLGRSSYDPSSRRNSVSVDRSLRYAEGSGTVSSVKDRFDRSTSIDRYGSTDRLSSRNSDYGGTSSRASAYSDTGSYRSYGSSRTERAPSVSRDYTRAPSASRDYSRAPSAARDYSRAPSVTRDYSRAPSVSRDYNRSHSAYGSSLTTREPSPSRSSSRLSSYDYSKPKDTTSSSSSYTPEKKRSKDFVLTPFETRRTRNTDFNLTPFSTRRGASTSTADLSSKKEEEKKEKKEEEVVSSDSVASDLDEDDKDSDLRYLTSRGTDPMEDDEDVYKSRRRREREREEMRGKKAIARKKTKTYVKKVYKWRRDRPKTEDKSCQVDTEELEKNDRSSSSSRYSSGYGGSSRYSGAGSSSAYNRGYYSSRYGGGSSSYGSGYGSSYGSGRSSYVSSRPPAYKPSYRRDEEKEKAEAEEKAKKEKEREEKEKEKEREKEREREKQQKEKDMERARARRSRDAIPRQSSYRLKGRTDDDEEEEKIEPTKSQSAFSPPRRRSARDTKEKKKEVVSLTSDNLTLKDSIEKVKSWKKQLSSDPPEAQYCTEGEEPKITPGKSRKAKDDRSPSPYDNLKVKRYQSTPALARRKPDRSPSPYDNIQNGTPKVHPAKSTESLFGDMSSEENSHLARSHSLLSLNSIEDTLPRKKKLLKGAKSMDSLSISTTSLPDLVPPSETSRRGRVFISGLTDIDSLLEFTETEDNLSSDDETTKKNAKNKKQGKNKRVLKKNKKDALTPLSEEPSSNNKKLRSQRSRSKSAGEDDFVYIGKCKDIDELLGSEETDNRVKVLNGNKKLMIDVSSPSVQHDIGSCESLLDTPVPDTPDVPLAPVSLFPSSPPPCAAQSMEHLNEVGKGPTLRRLNSKDRASKTKSVGDLNDLCSLLDTATSSKPPKAKKGRKSRRGSKTDSPFELFKNASNESLPSPDIVSCTSPQTPTAMLVDLSDESAPSTPTVYPADYSDEAIAEAKLLAKEKGKVTVKDLMDICKKPQGIRPPWLDSDEDPSFAGFKSMTELLENFYIDCKKVA